MGDGGKIIEVCGNFLVMVRMSSPKLLVARIATKRASGAVTVI